MRSDARVKHGIGALHADGDADCLIVERALAKANERPVSLVGRDTDLLVLLLYHFKPQYYGVYFVAGNKVWDIR